MYTKNDLMDSIHALGIRHDDTLMIHSSMKAIGEVEGGADTVIQSFLTYLTDGLLLFPTHTWRYVNRANKIYNPLTTPACVGILPNLFMKYPGVVRSLHPTHSVAAYGKDAENYIKEDLNAVTPCPRNGSFGKLYDKDAKILFLGVTLKSNTYIHSVEEWNQIPDRLSEDMVGFQVVLPDGTLFPHPVCTHYTSVGPDISQHYGKLEKPFFHHGIAVRGSIGDAECILLEARKVGDLTTMLLNQIPALMDDDAPIPYDLYHKLVI